jgi:hypothetical protein
VVGVPGLGAVLALHRPGECDLALRIALVPIFGYAVVGLCATVLALATVLSAATFVPLLAVGTVALWVLAVRRAPLREQLRSVVSDLRADSVGLGLGIVVLLAIAVTRLRFTGTLNFMWYGPWRYWSDGMDIANAGRVPTETLQWGAVYSPTVNKVVLNSFNGAMSYLIGDAPLPGMAALLFIATTALAAALWALGRELGLRFAAPLLPLAVMVLVRNPIRNDVSVYTAENLGRAVAVGAAALGIRAVRARSRRDAVVSGVLFGVGAATHMIPALVLGCVVALYAAAVLIVDGDRRVVLRRVGAVAGAAGCVGGVVLVLAGSVGFQGAREGSYANFSPSIDPTASLEAGEERPRRPQAGGWFARPSKIQDEYLDRALMPNDNGAWRYVVPIAGLLLAAVMLRWAPERLRPLGVMGIGLWAVLFGASLVFSHRYDTLIPGNFGASRLLDYALLSTLFVGLGAFEALLGRAEALSRLAPAALVVVAIVPAYVLGEPLLGPTTAAKRNGEQALATMNWVRRSIPCDARILPSRLTLGSFTAATGRVSTLEGMGPYLRPQMLKPVLDQVLGAREFFSDPARNAAYLEQQGIDYVLVLRPRLRVGSMNTAVNRDVNREALRNAPFLEPFGDSRFLEAYRVVNLPGAGTGSFPSPADFPWFKCENGPMDPGRFTLGS